MSQQRTSTKIRCELLKVRYLVCHPQNVICAVQEFTYNIVTGFIWSHTLHLLEVRFVSSLKNLSKLVNLGT